MRPMWIWMMVACGPPNEPEEDAPRDTVVAKDTDLPETLEVIDTDIADTVVVDTDDGIVRLTVVDGARQWADGTVAASCRAYREPGEGYAYGGEAGAGVYRISGDDGAREVFCDQDTDGGGWMLVIQLTASQGGLNLCSADAVGELELEAGVVSAPAKLSNAEIQDLWSRGDTREVLVKHDQDGWTDSTRVAWDRVCKLDFVDDHVFTTEQQVSDLADLDVPTATCFEGLSLPLVATNNNPYFCGWSFLSSGGSQVIAFSSTASYLGGACQQANAGRSWFGPPNSGCNAQKVFVR